MKRARLVVVGSSNTDMVVRSENLPKPGETVLGGQFMQDPGGKGANQAVAAARAGANVTFIACLGEDVYGRETLKHLHNEGVDVSRIITLPNVASGVALILVGEQGENIISVAPGANGCLAGPHIDTAESAIAEADLMLLQLEIPLETAWHSIEVARRNNTRVLLNPAPAPVSSIPDDAWPAIHYLTPNRGELARLTGMPIDTLKKTEAAAAALLERGVGTVVVTLGAKGAMLCAREGVTRVPALPVNPVDTVGAGDCFSACLAVGLAEGQPVAQAARFAAMAAALSTTRLGAQPSMPTREEIEAAMAGNV